MENRVLVVYASKYGSTEAIAVRIGEAIRQAGITVDVRKAEEIVDVTQYRAVVLGSAVYAGQWLKEAVKFLENNEKALTERMVWFFSSGPTGEGDPVKLMKGWQFPDAQKPIADRIGPRDVITFHGDLEMQKLNFAEKLIIKGVRAPVGDFRKWDEITAWGADIGATLRKEPMRS